MYKQFSKESRIELAGLIRARHTYKECAAELGQDSDFRGSQKVFHYEMLLDSLEQEFNLPVMVPADNSTLLVRKI